MDAMNLTPKAVARDSKRIKDGKICCFLALCALMIMLMVFWLYNKSTLNQANCTAMDKLYPNTAKIP